MNGIINVNKSAGWTSHDVVAKIRRLAGAKAGHTGTLDPQATGVLPICIGAATRLADFIMGGDKEYVAEIIFGTATDTMDATGQVTERVCPDFSRADFDSAIAGLIGNISQIPPMYAAIKVGGKKLYELARAGKEIARESRAVRINEIEVLGLDLPNYAKIRVSCSKGTYIRVLCGDIAAACGTLAHMGALIRTKSGNFAIEDSWDIDEIVKIAANNDLPSIITPLENIFPNYDKIIVNDMAKKILTNGNPINPRDTNAHSTTPGDRVFVYDTAGRLWGIHKYVESRGEIMLRPDIMLV